MGTCSLARCGAGNAPAAGGGRYATEPAPADESAGTSGAAVSAGPAFATGEDGFAVVVDRNARPGMGSSAATGTRRPPVESKEAQGARVGSPLCLRRDRCVGACISRGQWQFLMAGVVCAYLSRCGVVHEVCVPRFFARLTLRTLCSAVSDEYVLPAKKAGHRSGLVLQKGTILAGSLKDPC